MRLVLRMAAAVAAAAVLGAGSSGDVAGAAERVPEDALAVREGGRWVTFWRRDDAPARWDGERALAERISWRRGADGIEWGELRIRGASEAWRTRIVVARLDPRRIDLSLAPAFTDGRTWTVHEAGDDATLALDAGQFRHELPWGWVVTDGKEVLHPQYAPLAGAVVVDATGAVRIVAPDSVQHERAQGTAREAFQSYPMLLQDGAVPVSLRTEGLGVNLRHRDARLALGTLDDGRVVVALTRFDALGETLGRVPFGLTTPEMAAVMGALGCRQALLLDGGISGQLRLTDEDGAARTWSGSRRVPLGLIGRVRR
jgi:uncharacterized protein YigE (DUF2233 family)